MEEHTHQTLYRSGSNVVSVSSVFIYEVSLYMLYKNGAECIDNQFYKAVKPLKKDKSIYKKLDKDRTLAKYISLISAPEDYLITNKYNRINDEQAKNVRRRRKSSSGTSRRNNKNSRCV